MRELDDYINRVKTLPPAPRVLAELLTLLREENVDTDKVVTVLGYDPGLTASVLQLCNSAFFASSRPADDLNEAVARLGYERIFQLVTTLVGSRALAPAQKGYGIDKGELWKHSVAAAVAAQIVAKHLGDPDTTVYTATLLHDIGKVVLSEALEGKYDRLVEETERLHQPLLDTEKSILGVNHAEVGGRLLARWRLPANLVEAVTHHHSPLAAGDHARLASHVYLGNAIAHALGMGYGCLPFAMQGRGEVMELLGLSIDELPRFMIQTFEQLATIETLFRVAG